MDIFIDIDETLVYTGGELKLQGVPGFYRLAHGALEFLVALDRIPQMRLSFFSAGAPLRNRNITRYFKDEIKKRFNYELKEFDVFSLPPSRCGKKCLKSLKSNIGMECSILVDDLGKVEPGEERNLLKIYEVDSGVPSMRLDNNLVRALGLVLLSMELCNQNDCTFVDALNNLQRDDSGKYLHEKSNSPEIYERGLVTMQDVNPALVLKMSCPT